MLSDRKGSALSKYLTLNDRILIERFIIEGYSFSFIAKKLARNPSTIAREVKSHRRFVTKARDDVNDCVSFFRCLHRNLCDTETKYSCFTFNPAGRRKFSEKKEKPFGFSFYYSISVSSSSVPEQKWRRRSGRPKWSDGRQPPAKDW